MKKILETLKSKWLRETSLTIVLIAIIIAAFVILNIFIKSLDLTDIDMTKEQLYSLSEESKEQISQIPQDEKIDIYIFDYQENSGIVDLAKQYAKLNENINITVTTVADRKDIAEKYEISEGYGSILIVDGEKYKIYNYSDLYIQDYNSGDFIDLAEQRFTNGIIDVSSIGKTTNIYFLTGHEEYSTETEMTLLKYFMELENYEVKTLNLLSQENIPEDCEALAIASPRKDFTELETQKIKDYINKGGNILWMNDPFLTKEDLKNAQSILDLYGVTIDSKGIIYEQNIDMMALQTPYIIIPKINPSEIAGKLADKGTVILLQSSKLDFVDDQKLSELNVAKTDLLSTSESAFFRTDLSIADNLTSTEKDKVGKFTLGAVLSKKIDEEKTSELVVYASNFFVTDGIITIGQQPRTTISLSNNRDMIMNSIAYVADKDDSITIRKVVDETYYTPTENQDRLIKFIIYGAPVIIIIAGIVIWQLRRRKK